DKTTLPTPEENDIADMASKAYTGGSASAATPTAFMNVPVFLSQLNIGSTVTTSSAANWTLGVDTGSGSPALTFKALSGTAVLNGSWQRNGKQAGFSVPLVFASNTTVNMTTAASNADYLAILGTVSGSGNITLNTPNPGGSGGGGGFLFGADRTHAVGTS